jgi:hypothetical protein
MRPLLLKVAATSLTLGATVASAFYVSAHLKNAAAPLQPAVVGAQQGSGSSALDGAVVVGSSVHPTDQPPLTSTYAS